MPSALLKTFSCKHGSSTHIGFSRSKLLLDCVIVLPKAKGATALASLVWSPILYFSKNFYRDGEHDCWEPPDSHFPLEIQIQIKVKIKF